MSKISKEVKKKETTKKDKPVVNFMDGISFEMDPITTLKMVAASSIFGEPQYYRDGMKQKAYLRREAPSWIRDELLLIPEEDSSAYMERIIDEALDYDFKEVLEVAKSMRNDFNMRLNPQVIMVRAAMHPKRSEFNQANPGVFANVQKEVMKRADEPASQLAYWLYKKESKNSIPSILKRTWADKLSSLSRYQVAKYKNSEVGMIDTVRICHASSPVLDELMKNGTVEVEENEQTWENMRSAGKSWEEILTTIPFGHMWVLRNLRNIAKGLSSDCPTHVELMEKTLKQLVDTVENGKQFPFRYYTAYKMIKREDDLDFQVKIMEALEECLQKSLNNLPFLTGKTMVLSDNSGSAWGTLNSEYGTVKVAEIGNLSAVLTAMRSDEGYVGVFGDRLTVVPIKKNSSILDNLEKVNEAGQHVGGGTETGIWLFFDEAIDKNQHWDNIFIYSDMQAGYGQLYCTHSEGDRYKKACKKYSVDSKTDGEYVDVMALLNYYRSHVYRDVDVFTIQTAGYNNNILPQHAYRTSILYGWTGKEVLFADTIKKIWNSITKDEK